METKRALGEPMSLLKDKNCSPETVCGQKKLEGDDLGSRSDRPGQKIGLRFPVPPPLSTKLGIKITGNEHNVRRMQSSE